MEFDHNAPSPEFLAARHEPFFRRYRSRRPETPVLPAQEASQPTASRDDANGTFLYDVKKGCWSKTLCRMLEINMDHLPELCDSTDQVGKLLPRGAEELGLAAGTPVFSAPSTAKKRFCRLPFETETGEQTAPLFACFLTCGCRAWRSAHGSG